MRRLVAVNESALPILGRSITRRSKIGVNTPVIKFHMIIAELANAVP